MKPFIVIYLFLDSIMRQDVDQGDEVDLLLGRSLLAGDGVDVEFRDDALVAQRRLSAQPAPARTVRRCVVAPSAPHNGHIYFILIRPLTGVHERNLPATTYYSYSLYD